MWSRTKWKIMLQFLKIIFICTFNHLLMCQLPKHQCVWYVWRSDTGCVGCLKSQTYVFWFRHIVIWVYLRRVCVLLRNPPKKNHNHTSGETIHCVAIVFTLRFALRRTQARHRYSIFELCYSPKKTRLQFRHTSMTLTCSTFEYTFWWGRMKQQMKALQKWWTLLLPGLCKQLGHHH